VTPRTCSRKHPSSTPATTPAAAELPLSRAPPAPRRRREANPPVGERSRAGSSPDGELGCRSPWLRMGLEKGVKVVVFFGAGNTDGRVEL